MSHTDYKLENSNYSRIAYLLMQEGTKRAQEAVLKNIPERLTFAQVLDDKRNKLHELMTKQRILSKSQYELLYPFTGDLSKIDISLWLVLARNITTKSSRKGINWFKSPEKHETLWSHDLIRIREIRNFLFHVGAPELVGDKLSEIKRELFSVLKRLGTTDDVINSHMTRDLDPQQTKISELQIQEQYVEEQNVLLQEAAKHKRYTRLLTLVLSLLAVLVIIGLSILLYWYFRQDVPCSKYVKRILSKNGVLYFMPRNGWNAAPMKKPYSVANLTKPVKTAAVFHTATIFEACGMTEHCCETVRYIQKVQMNGQYDDIAYSYLIGNDGVVYEGRGSQYEQAAAWGHHTDIISIAMIGHFDCVKPSPEAMAALYVFLEYLTEKDPVTENKEKILHHNYHLYGHCQINIKTPEHNVSFSDSPGAGIMQEIQYWSQHWKQDNITECDVNKDCLMSSVCCKKSCRGAMVNV